MSNVINNSPIGGDSGAETALAEIGSAPDNTPLAYQAKVGAQIVVYQVQHLMHTVKLSLTLQLI